MFVPAECPRGSRSGAAARPKGRRPLATTARVLGRCSAGFYDENGLAHTLARDAITHPSLVAGGRRDADQPEDPGMLVIRAQHAKTGKVSVLKIKKGTKMASVFEAHAKHKGLKSQSLSVMKNKPRPAAAPAPAPQV